LATAAKRYNCDVSCETCPHYLSLSDEDMQRMGAIAKCAPPLRSDVERKYFWDHLSDERLICVASDHSPAPASMKSAGDFFDAWGGISGVQSTLPILLSHRPAVDLPHVARLTSSNIAKRFNIAHKGRIEAGFDADLTLVDLNRTSELTREKLLDRNQLSPYVGWTFLCSIRRTILRGQTIFAEGKTLGGPRGRLVVPARS
jgi:allantoinase